jgi:hypothetical protein
MAVIASGIGRAGLSSAAVGAIGESLGDAIGKVPGSSAFKAGVSKIGQALGTGIGSIAGPLIAFGIVAVLAEKLWEQIQANRGQLEAIGAGVSQIIVEGSTAELQRSRAALQKGINDLWIIPGVLTLSQSAQREMQGKLDAVDAELARRASGIAPHVGAELAGGEPVVTDAAEQMVDGVPGAVDAAAADAKTAGAKIPVSIAEGIISKGNESKDAMASLRDAMKREMNPMTEIARNIGILTSKTLAHGLKDGRPGVRPRPSGSRRSPRTGSPS